ncbi:DUF4097 domain-containing protein [Aegicerativicinus sediminis]|uniref:DUF4097 domain-containing protein n=1 Tax=Aegicerativicinus sediminis TaxID=2893202 RepID=UPI001E4D6C35|nr:DUF4097 domain-containing protein [Aegicerativicinus sediminis]
MKRTVLFKSLFILFIIPAIALGTNGEWKGKYTKEKTIKKEFSVNKDALLKVDNSYGNITIVTYNGSTTSIEVVIKVNGNNEDKVMDKLNDIDVQFDASSSIVSAKTVFGKEKSWWNSGKNNVSMEINYRISLPITNSVDLNNDYGSIDLERLEGRAVINCDYGKITTKELMAESNVLKFDYTSSSYFGYINSAKINADYSSYTIAKAKNLEISADYTKSEIENAENVTYNCDYGSLKIDNVNNLMGNGDYLTTRIGNVYGNVQIKADYGSIDIGKLAKDAGNVSIDSDYIGIDIGYDAGFSFSFDVNLSYANLKGDTDFDFNKKSVESSSKKYTGTYGSKNSGNLISIKSNYGSVNFQKK